MKARFIVKHLPSGEVYRGVWFKTTESSIGKNHEFLYKICEESCRFSMDIRNSNGVKEHIVLPKNIIKESVFSLFVKDDNHEQ